MSENLAAGGIIEPEPNLKRDESAKDPLPHLDYDDSSPLNSIIHVVINYVIREGDKINTTLRMTKYI